MQASSQEAKDDRLTGAADNRVIVIRECHASHNMLLHISAHFVHGQAKKLNFKVCLYFKVIPVGS